MKPAVFGMPLRAVERALHQREAHQRLRAGQEDPAARGGEIVGQLA